MTKRQEEIAEVEKDLWGAAQSRKRACRSQAVAQHCGRRRARRV
jgi:hypothetical protein